MWRLAECVLLSDFLNTCLRQGGVEDEDEAAEAGTLDDISSSTFQSCLAAVVDTLSQHNQRFDFWLGCGGRKHFNEAI